MALEHKVIRTRAPLEQDRLDQITAGGWEFIQSIHEPAGVFAVGDAFIHYFKREKPDD